MKMCLFPDEFCAGFVLGAAAGWVEARPGERAERAHQVVEGVRLQEMMAVVRVGGFGPAGLSN